MNKNRFLYLVKLIASLMVITLHAPFGGWFGDIVYSIARFTVPFFFVVSGRFLLTRRKRSAQVVKDEAVGDRISVSINGAAPGGESRIRTVKGTAPVRKETLRALKKICRVTGIVYLVYLIYSLFFYLSGGMSISEWFTMKFNACEASIFFLFNSGRFIYDGSFVFDHMWYLFATIYVYALIFIFAPVLRKWYRALVVMLMGLLFFGEVLQSVYPIRPFDISINTWYILRNWLLVGMPFILLGILFSDHCEKLCSELSDDEYAYKFSRLKLPAILMTLFGAAESVFEQFTVGDKFVHLGSLLIVIGIMILSECDIPVGNVLWKVGESAPNNIYFYHVLVIAILDFLSQRGVIPEYPMWMKPLIVMAICICLFVTAPLVKAVREKRSMAAGK